MKPQMSSDEILVIEQVLLHHGSQVDVLEWGTGGSTVYFTQVLREQGVSYSWTGIEYNRLWHKRINELLQSDPRVHLVLFDVGNAANKQRDLTMDEYVAYPATLGKKFDVILVDGRKRRRCLLEAAKLLKSGGIVLLHDARRSYYHCAFRAYPDSRMLLWSGLWQGRLEDPGLARWALNAVLYGCFRVYVWALRFKRISQ